MSGLKTHLKRIPVFGPASVWVSSRLKGTWITDPRNWLAVLLPEPDVQIVQIGSNDGRTDDPIHKLLLSRKGWKALFVEPVPYLFERLTRSHPPDPRFRYENAAIHEGGSAHFHWVDERARQQLPDLPEWYDQLGSFDRQHILKHLDGILEPFIVSQEIKGITLGDLLVKHGITRLDLLHIDTEGHDYKVLSQLDLSRHQPSVILFEHKHLAQHERAASIHHLAGHYELYDLGSDFLAVNRTRLPQFARKLAALEARKVVA